jgi:hypothetical protein
MTKTQWLIRSFAFSILIFFSAHCFSIQTPDELLGVWEPGDRGVQATYGRLKISKRMIQFSMDGRRWKCATAYEIVEMGDADSYALTNPPFPPEVKFWHYFNVRLLNKSKCIGPITNFVFAFMDDSSDFLGFVDFTNISKPSATGHFHRASIGR